MLKENVKIEIVLSHLRRILWWAGLYTKTHLSISLYFNDSDYDLNSKGG